MYSPNPSSDIMAALDAAAAEVVMAPLSAWPGWIVYLLEALEALDADAVATGDDDETLESVRGAIAGRLARGRW
mgnify:CR=1 FL=1